MLNGILMAAVGYRYRYEHAIWVVFTGFATKTHDVLIWVNVFLFLRGPNIDGILMVI